MAGGWEGGIVRCPPIPIEGRSVGQHGAGMRNRLRFCSLR